MKTKLFTLLAFTMLGLLVGVTESNAQSLNKGGGVGIREYPNPTNETAFIESVLPAKRVGSAVIQITSMSGQVMFNKECSDCVGKSTHPVDVTLWPAGLYIVTMTYKGREFAAKFIVYN